MRRMMVCGDELQRRERTGKSRWLIDWRTGEHVGWRCLRDEEGAMQSKLAANFFRLIRSATILSSLQKSKTSECIPNAIPEQHNQRIVIQSSRNTAK